MEVDDPLSDLMSDETLGADLLGDHGDRDGDGIPNWGDDWFGPGAESPFGAPSGFLGADGAELGQLEDIGHELGAEVDNMTMTDEGSLLSSVGPAAPDSEYWHPQEGDNSCAVACQRGILEAVTGESFSESELSTFAEERGWYDPEIGTPMSSVGNLLEANGIPVTQGHDRSLLDLVEALQSDQKIIVGLDANEIWHPMDDVNGSPAELPDLGHAVRVTDISLNDAGALEVTVNDTGIPDGHGKVLAAEDFLNAWDDFGNHATITAIT